MRQKKCSVCETEFSYEVRRGCERRTVCSDACKQQKAERRRKEIRASIVAICRIEGCTRTVTRRKVGLCEGCYCRIRRNGDPAWRVRAGLRRPTMHSGYVLISDPSHPLVGKSGALGEHRIVLYQKIGPGAHPCHWCGTSVRWDVGRGKEGSLVVDHVNDVKTDNRPENLVPACNSCNRARGAMWPFLRRMLPQSIEHLISLMRGIQVAPERTA